MLLGEQAYEDPEVIIKLLKEQTKEEKS